jgi:hypothetical protein
MGDIFTRDEIIHSKRMRMSRKASKENGDKSQTQRQTTEMEKEQEQRIPTNYRFYGNPDFLFLYACYYFPQWYHRM